MKQFTTWGEAYDWYWNNVAKHQKQAKQFRINSNQIFNYAGNSFPLSRMEKGMFWIEFQNHLLEENPTMSGSTVNRILSVATTVLKRTNESGLHSVELPHFKRQKEGEGRLVWFSKDQVEKMAFHATDVFGREDLSEAIIFAAFTGLRQAEMLKLKPEDIDLDKGIIYVGGKPKNTTKTGNCRMVPIHSKVLPILENRLNNRRRIFGDDWLNKDQLYRAFRKVRKYCGISEDYVWHSLRHSCGTFLGEVTHPRQIMAIMGHKSLTTSLRYTHATDKSLRNAMDAI